jgi:hypothetical protein
LDRKAEKEEREKRVFEAAKKAWGNGVSSVRIWPIEGI